MISIEAITTALGLKKLEEGKALIRAQVAKVPIRINKNIVSPLVKKGLVAKTASGCYELTLKGRRVKIRFHRINISLEDYFRIDDMHAFVVSHTHRRKPIFKVMNTTCMSCACENTSLDYIVDETGVEGAYCSECLKTKGYYESKTAMMERRRKARTESVF